MRRLFLAAALLFGLANVANAAVDVGTLAKPGDSIVAPIVFNTSFNTTLQDPLVFEIAKGSQGGSVRLDLIAGNNVILAGAAIEGAATLGKVPLSIFSDALTPGLHPFAISAATGQGAVGGLMSS